MVIRRSACRANKWKCRERIEPWREKSRRSVRRRREGERGESINRGGNHSCGKQLLKNIPELGTRTIDGTNGVRSPIVDGGTRYLDSCYPPPSGRTNVTPRSHRSGTRIPAPTITRPRKWGKWRKLATVESDSINKTPFRSYLIR